MIDQLIQLVYLVATALFIFSLKWMSDPATARRGVFAGVGGMALAIIGTLLHPLIIGYSWIAIPLVLGALAGVPLSWVPLTAVPQRTALSHAFGGLAAGLVGTAKYFLWAEHDQLTTFRMGAIAVEVILGYLTCTGSLVAAGKLQEVIPTRPIVYRGQNVINFTLLAAAIAIAVMLMIDPSRTYLFPGLIVLALAFGVLLVLPIGGADMPTVISLLNSYAGLAAVAMGFVMENIGRADRDRPALPGRRHSPTCLYARRRARLDHDRATWPAGRRDCARPLPVGIGSSPFALYSIGFDHGDHRGARGPAVTADPAVRDLAEKIAEFAGALGDESPHYRGERPVAPPTFAATITSPAWQLMFDDPELELALRRIVHGDQRFDYARPLRAGDVVSATRPPSTGSGPGGAARSSPHP